MSSTPTPEVPGPSISGQVRTLAVRINDGLRAQLDVLAQLNDVSTTEVIRQAIEDWIDKSKRDPKVLKAADAVKAEIEREAQTRRDAIAAIFAGDGSTGGKPSTKPAAAPKRP